MGIATTPDVEESTEPPICGLKEPTSSSPTTAATLSCDQREINKKPTASETSPSLFSSPHQQARQELSEGSADQVKNAHLLDPSALAILLQTDLRYIINAPPSKAFFLIKSSSNGISDTEADLRLKRDGSNRACEFKGISVWAILLRQVCNSLTIVSFAIQRLCAMLGGYLSNLLSTTKVLLITMALSFGIDDYIEGGVITAVILLNIVVGHVLNNIYCY